jgi:hypothetical protein
MTAFRMIPYGTSKKLRSNINKALEAINSHSAQQRILGIRFCFYYWGE